MRRILIESVLLWRLRPTRPELNPEQLTGGVATSLAHLRFPAGSRPGHGLRI